MQLIVEGSWPYVGAGSTCRSFASEGCLPSALTAERKTANSAEGHHRKGFSGEKTFEWKLKRWVRVTIWTMRGGLSRQRKCAEMWRWVWYGATGEWQLRAPRTRGTSSWRGRGGGGATGRQGTGTGFIFWTRGDNIQPWARSWTFYLTAVWR